MNIHRTAIQKKYKLNISFGEAAWVIPREYGYYRDIMKQVAYQAILHNLFADATYAVHGFTDGSDMSVIELDVHDRPVYITIERDYTVVTLHAPVLPYVAPSDYKALEHSWAKRTPLTFDRQASGVLMVQTSCPYDTFIAQTPDLLPRFCNQSRELTSNISAYLQRRERRMRLAAQLPSTLSAAS